MSRAGMHAHAAGVELVNAADNLHTLRGDRGGDDWLGADEICNLISNIAFDSVCKEVAGPRANVIEHRTNGVGEHADRARRLDSFFNGRNGGLDCPATLVA